MFFALSKTLGIMLLPSNFLIGLGLIGAALLLTRFASLGRQFMVASAVLLGICAFSPLGNWLMLPLETRFPPWDESRGAPDGIIVLGGEIKPNRSAAHGMAVFGRSANRIIGAAVLAHRYPQARILISGGNASLIGNDDAKEADWTAQLFESLGVPADRLMIERHSRNTYENAVFSKELAEPKPGERWLLVTSAYHMPRSMGLFRKAGFAVEPYPVDWWTKGRGDLFAFATLSLERLGVLDAAAREWMGLIAYRIAGRTDELFPGPEG